MPPGLIHEENGMGARRHLGRDFLEMPLHGLGVAARQDEGLADTPRGTDGPEDPGRLRALILEGSGPGSPDGPSPRELGFLADPCFVLPPKFYRGVDRECGPDFCQLGGKVFLKSSMANSFCP